METIKFVPDHMVHVNPLTGDIRVQGAKILVGVLGEETIISNTSEVLYAGDDLTPQPKSVKDIAGAIWTKDLVKKGRERRIAEGNGAAIQELVKKTMDAEREVKT